MRYLVTSDVHLGSDYSRVALFNELLDRLHPDVALVLGGDIVDDPRKPLTGGAAEAVERLARRSGESLVVWVNGNHDDLYRPPAADRIEFHQTYRIGNQLLVTHGDRFDNVMPFNGWFIRCFQFLHEMRIRLGTPPVHVAEYAKRFPLLYSFLCRNVRENAIEHARETGVPAIVCGHVHFAEETSRDGIRYFNLGSWTEDPSWCLLVGDDTLELHPTPVALKRKDWFNATEAPA